MLALEADAKAHGAGQSYLVDHSAGSGKSNTIAWTAHRLSNLHDTTDTKVFDEVPDRLVLDPQLQETIYQFEHARGVVGRSTRTQRSSPRPSGVEQALIILTTLQKFPFVLERSRISPRGATP